MTKTKPFYTKAIAGVSILAGVALLASQNNEITEAESLETSAEIRTANSIIVERKPEQTLKTISSQKHEKTEEEWEDPFKGKEVKYRFQQIAAQYAEEIQYPDFSRPITSEHKLVEYKPNLAIETSRPINLDDVDGEVMADSPRISLKTSKFKYFRGEEVEANAAISGLSANSSVSVTATVRVGREVVATAREVTQLESANDDGSRQYLIHFDDLSDIRAGDQGELDIVAEFGVDGQHYLVTSLIRYPNVVARLDKVGDAQVEGEYLTIPMHVSTSSPGIHAIKGNLYDAATNTPLVHLSAVERLTSDSGELVLKAHIAALKKMGHEGPYELRDLSLTRGASAPKYTVEDGLVEASSYSVMGFSFNEYEDVAYVDERAQARLEFLTKLYQK